MAKIHRRIEAREMILGLCDDMAKEFGLSEKDIQATLLQCARRYGFQEQEALSTMSAEEAKAYGNLPIGFGVYATANVCNVPRDYLEWLADKNLQLQRYLRATQ